jgi:hypothetical protein
LVVGLSAALFWLGSMRTNLKWGIRWGTLSCVGGYTTFLYLTLGLPGTANLINLSGSVAVALISIVGLILGWAIAGIWWWLEQKKKKNSSNVVK